MFQFVDGALYIELTAVIYCQWDGGIVQAPAVAVRERLFDMWTVGRRHNRNRKHYFIRFWWKTSCHEMYLHSIVRKFLESRHRATSVFM
jgi:hypothetical protein